MENNFEINIAWLYPDLLNICGDTGNIYALKKRLEWRNINVNIDKLTLNDDINYEKYDMYYISGGHANQQIIVANDIQRHKNSFKNLADKGVVMFAVAGGFQLFCKYYQDINGNIYDGLEIFDAYTIESKKRYTGNVTVETDFLSDKILVGFESHTGLTYLENNTKSLGKVIIGIGNNTETSEDGAIYNNAIGTYLQSSILPKNPVFCDYLLEKAIQYNLKDEKYTIPPIDNVLENLTHKNLIQKAY